MAIFNKPDQQADYSSNVTTIAAGSSITGQINIQCELHIDGEVSAEIQSSSTIKIGQTGVVTGDIAANALIVAGKFQGNADCDSIELISGGEAEGKLTATSLTIDASSSFQGESVRKQPGSGSKVVSFSSDNSASDEDGEDEDESNVAPGDKAY